MSSKPTAFCPALLPIVGALLVAFASNAGAQGFIDPAELNAPETGKFTLSLLSDQQTYHSKDHMVLILLSQETCKLTVADVDSTGEGTVLFPNKLQSDNRLDAGKALVLGDKASPIRLVAGDTETHTIVAQCVTPAGALVRKTIQLQVE